MESYKSRNWSAVFLAGIIAGTVGICAVVTLMYWVSFGWKVVYP